jgi:DNA-directed RNA polymerase specialized sigma24 family protein
MADRDAWEQRLYRFARVLLRDEAAARALVLEILESAARKSVPADLDELVVRQFQEVRRRALKLRSAGSVIAARGELPDGATAHVQRMDAGALETALNALLEPGRSALTLLALDAMDADRIAKVLELAPEDFAEVLHAARLDLCASLATGAPQS